MVVIDHGREYDLLDMRAILARRRRDDNLTAFRCGGSTLRAELAAGRMPDDRFERFGTVAEVPNTHFFNCLCCSTLARPSTDIHPAIPWIVLATDDLDPTACVVEFGGLREAAAFKERAAPHAAMPVAVFFEHNQELVPVGEIDEKVISRAAQGAYGYGNQHNSRFYVHGSLFLRLATNRDVFGRKASVPVTPGISIITQLAGARAAGKLERIAS